MATNLIFNCYLLLNGKWKALGQHGDLVLLKSFRSNIQDGHHLATLAIFKPHLLPNGSRIELKDGGKHLGDTEIQNC